MFEELRPWDHKVVSRAIFLWLKIQGISVQAWEEVSFKTLAGLVGTYIKMDEATTTKRRLDVARILISASSSKTVFRNVTAKIDQDLFNIRLTEDLWGEVSVSDRKDQLYKMVSNSSSEESDAMSFDGLWVSETLEPGCQRAEGEIDFRQGGEGNISNFMDGQIDLGDCVRDCMAVNVEEKGVESDLYDSIDRAAKFHRGSVAKSKTQLGHLVKKSASCPDLRGIAVEGDKGLSNKSYSESGLMGQREYQDPFHNQLQRYPLKNLATDAGAGQIEHLGFAEVGPNMGLVVKRPSRRHKGMRDVTVNYFSIKFWRQLKEIK